MTMRGISRVEGTLAEKPAKKGGIRGDRQQRKYLRFRVISTTVSFNFVPVYIVVGFHPVDSNTGLRLEQICVLW